MKKQFNTQQEAIDAIIEIDRQMSFPDPVSGTLTWAIPELIINEDGNEKWEIPLPESNDIVETENNTINEY